MYGSDALAGTINIITNQATFTRKSSGCTFNGFYSSNENGMRGTGTVGVTTPRFPCASRPAPKTTTTTRPAASTRRTRGRCLRRAC